MDTPITADAVADYLRHHPNFFADHADVMADVLVPHPHGGHAIPIAERQIVTLRERNGDLERQLRELLRYGRENDTIGEKLHRVTLALFASPDLATTLALLYASLKEDFGVPQVAARLWPQPGLDLANLWSDDAEPPDLPEFAAVSEDLKNYAEGMGAPYCGQAAPFDTRQWFPVPEACISCALLPLRSVRTFGLLALASDDPQRFHAGMGTMYLTRLSELASVAAARILPAS